MKVNFDISGIKFILIGGLVFSIGWLMGVLKVETIGDKVLVIGEGIVLYGMIRHFVIMFKNK